MSSRSWAASMTSWVSRSARVTTGGAVLRTNDLLDQRHVHSSARLYLEGRSAPLRFARGERLRVPCGAIRFAHESPFPPRSWIERGYRLERFTEVPLGGHFAALEETDRLVEDIRDFFRPLREGRLARVDGG